MPRPNVPPPKDVIAIAKGLKAEGINTAVIRCADGTEIEWREGGTSEVAVSELEKWKASRDAAS